MTTTEYKPMKILFEYLVENASFIVNRELEHYEGSGFVISLEGYTIQIPSVMLNYNIFSALMHTYVSNIEGDLYIDAWLDEHELKFNFNISIIDPDIESALDKAERRREGSVRPLVFYRMKKIDK